MNLQPFPERQRLLAENERLEAWRDFGAMLNRGVAQPALTDERVEQMKAQCRRDGAYSLFLACDELLRLRRGLVDARDYPHITQMALAERDALRATLDRVVERLTTVACLENEGHCFICLKLISDHNEHCPLKETE